MDGVESFRCVCRVCRSYDLSLNWNEDLDEFIRMSYKNCFYKYTQFKEKTVDPLSQFLCEECATGVKNFHLLVEKSIETLKLCEEQFAIVNRDKGIEISSTVSSVVDNNRLPKKENPCDVYSEDLTLNQNDSYFPIEYSFTSSRHHDIALQESKIDVYINEKDSKRTLCSDLDVLATSADSFSKDIKINDNPEQNLEQDHELANSETNPGILGLNSSAENAMMQEYNNTDNIHKIECIEFVDSETILSEETGVQNMLEEDLNIVQKKHATRLSDAKCRASNANHIILDYDDKQPSRISKTPVMCSYCSKMVHNIYYLKLHEQTHEENRSREVSCPTCGIKLFNKQALYVHKKTHDKNRVKKFKCEFCDKAFFNRGACNVHRRIHLGQMTQCPLCPKQFYRQLELDRHMPSHSHESLNSCKPAKPKKYYVHCKECDKKVLSDRFNAHRAVHMNDPFMRCTICEKDFFSRKSGGKHMACVHKRKAGHYDDIAFYYKNKNRPRLSFLIMRQQEDVEPVA